MRAVSRYAQFPQTILGINKRKEKLWKIINLPSAPKVAIFMYSGYSLKKKKTNLLSSNSGSQKSEAMSYWAMIKALAGGSGGESIPLPLHLLEVTHMPWRVVPFCIFTMYCLSKWRISSQASFFRVFTSCSEASSPC